MPDLVELVFIPTPAMGHILSMVELAKLILRRSQCISITIYIINTPINSDKISDFVGVQSRDNLYPTRLTFVTFPPLPRLPDKNSTLIYVPFIELHEPLVKQAVEDRIQAGSGKPVGFVLDMFCAGLVDIANELDIPSYLFFASGANFLNVMFYAQSLTDDHGVDIATMFSDPVGSLKDVPGFKNPVPCKVIPGVLKDMEHEGCEMLLNFARKFRETKGILINTYLELELFQIQALLDSDDKSVPPIYTIGPILELGDQNRGGSDNHKESLIRWLDDQPKSSVVFLCFGSLGRFDEEQVKEIAKGLDRLEYRFLWVLRKPFPKGGPRAPTDKEPFLEALPDGFIDRTISRAKIIEWAPQVDVLAHPAIGGFVSHCGWNSILESLWFGVPIATWPMYAEQQLNAFGLVKETDLAVEIRMDYKKASKDKKGNFLVSAEEIEKAVTKLMNMDGKMKENVEKMCGTGKNAIKIGGSSYNSMGQFIDDVLSKAT